jgi:hypothetical protein
VARPRRRKPQAARAARQRRGRSERRKR